MSTLDPVLIAPKMTLAALIDITLANEHLAENTRREMASAIRTVSAVLKAEPHQIPASQKELRPLIANALPTSIGVSASRWCNSKSLLRRAIAQIDLDMIPVRAKGVLLPEWAALLAPLTQAPLIRGLSRFSKYCSMKGIAPEAVTQEIYDTYYAHLTEHGLMRSARETQQTAGRAWNAARKTIEGWPNVELTIQRFRRNPSMEWSEFPESLKRDAESYLTPMSDEEFDLFHDGPILRSSTIKSKFLQIRQFATAVVKSGRDPATLRSLADLVEKKTAGEGLQVLLDRGADKQTSRNYAMAYLLLNIARHHVKADDDTLQTLKKFCKKLSPKIIGMTAKNKKRLQQFNDPRQLAALLNIPEKLMKEATKAREPAKQEARVAQMAVANEILLMAPLRIKNISQLEIGRTLILDGTKSGYILIAGSEVKNDFDIELPLPQMTLRTIDVYLKRFHPLLAPPGSKMLFPSEDFGHKRTTVLSHQITMCIRRRCGIELNPHLFRHLAAKLYLDAFPGAYGIIRLLLGHKNIGTTIRTYCGTEQDRAFRAYDKFITGVRGTGTGATPQIRFRKESV